LPLDEDVIDAAMRSAVAGIDVSEYGAAAVIWNAFLEFAAHPLDFGERFDDDKDNDLINFEVTKRPPNVYVTIARRVGVTLAESWDYQGTIVAGCDMTLAYTDAWAHVRDLQTINGYGVTNNGLPDTRERIETSEAFAALAGSQVLRLVASAHYG
jgi:hypothetical protein